MPDMSMRMNSQIELFKFTLGNDQSISPSVLQALWARACQTSKVAVSRHVPGGLGTAERPIYSLYGPQQIHDLPQVEKRLRQLLDEASLRVSLIALHS
jgi:hypothetical protein